IGLVETNLSQLTTVADGTVAIDTDGVMFINHTGVWQRVSGQGGTISTIVGNNGISASEVAGTVTLDVDPGNGVIIDGSQNVAVGDGAGVVVNANDVAVGDGDGIVVNANDVAVGDGAGIVVNANDVEVGQGDGIQVNADDVAVDDTVLRTFGDQEITGNKIFSDITVTNLTAVNQVVYNLAVSNTAIFASNMFLSGVLDMGGYQITNLIAATRGDMAINYTQFTNANQSGSADLQGATNQVLIDSKTYTDSATNALMIDAEDRFVNEDGDDMTGILGMGDNTITNLAPATRGDMAVNYSQLTNATSDLSGDIAGATNAVLNTAINYTDAATNSVLNTANNYTDSATNTVLNTANNYTDAATNDLMNDAVTRFVDAAGDDMTGILGMGGNTITNLGPATRGDMAVNYDQLTNAAHQSSQDLAGATNQVLIDSKTYTDSATNAVGTTWDDRWVNQDGDTMSGSLDMGNNDISNVNYLAVKDLYAENETVINIVVSNTALVTTSLTVQGVIDVTGHNITNLAAATRGDMAVNYDQLTNATSDLSSDIAGATNAVLNTAIDYTDAATNSVLNIANNYTDGATNQTMIDARSYTDGATNQTMIDARSYTDGATNQTLIDARSYSEDYTDSATNTLMNDADARFVNAAGDVMTGILDMGGNRITNVADAVNPQDAITKSQLDAATNSLAGDVTLQKAYVNGNTITTSAGEGDVTIGGSEQLNITATDGVNIDETLAVGGGASVTGGNLDINNGNNVNVNGGGNVELENAGSVYVDGAGGGQVNVDGNTGDESIRLNGAGKMVIYSGGSIALEFE
ncbi:MAG: hypothetical protein DRQ64_10280, partial [Gammaproteobacteria bacterium]